MPNLHFKNLYPGKVYVTVSYRDDGVCNDKGWKVEGWWPLDSGDEAFVARVGYSYAAFYAHTGDYSRFWAGTYMNLYVPYGRFTSCSDYLGNELTNTRLVGFRFKDIGTGDDYYVRLVP